jgi:hypothetical protein
MAEIPQEARIFKGATRERVRRALVNALEGETREDKKIVSVAKLRSAGSGDQNATTTLLRCWRAGQLSVADSWDDPAPPPAPVAAPPPRPDEDDGLAARVRGAQTHDDLLAAGKAIALELLRGGIDEDMADSLKQLLTEMRQSVKGRALEPKEVVENVLPVTEEAAPLVEAFEAITDDDTRARLLELVQAAVEEDRRRRPALDTGGAAAEG